MIGRADLLRQRPIKLAKTDGLDLSFLTTFAGPSGKSSTRRTQEVHSNGPVLDDRILADPEVMDAIKNEKVRSVLTGSCRKQQEAAGSCRQPPDRGFGGLCSHSL